MKVVVSATDQSIDAPMDQRFGRAPWFVLVDSQTGEWSAHANGAVESGHGAGIESQPYRGRPGSGGRRHRRRGPERPSHAPGSGYPRVQRAWGDGT